MEVSQNENGGFFMLGGSLCCGKYSAQLSPSHPITPMPPIWYPIVKSTALHHMEQDLGLEEKRGRVFFVKELLSPLLFVLRVVVPWMLSWSRS